MEVADDVRTELFPGHDALRIVTVADVRRAQELLMRAFEAAGSLVEEVKDVPGVLARLSHDPRPDLILLEWDAAGKEEMEMLQRLGEAGARPALLLMGARNDADITAAGSVAAGESRAGTAALGQLVQSLAAAIVSTRAKPGETGVAFAPPPAEGSQGVLRLDMCRAYWNGRRVGLSLTEFRVVSQMAVSPGVDFSHRDIYDIMRGEGVVSGRGDEGYRGNVRAAIKRIRRKFVRVDAGFGAIRSYHGFGYHWDEATVVERSEVEGEDASAADSSSSAAGTGSATAY